MSKDAKSTEPEVQKVEKQKEKFYRVKFNAKSSPSDQDDVQLSVNGDIIVIPRQVETIISERYKVAADNARAPQFRQMPNESRKIIGEVQTFPYHILGASTEEEYLKLKRTGTKLTRDANAQEGAANE